MTILFNTALISKFKTEMYRTLLYKHNLSTTTPKVVEIIEYDNELVASTVAKTEGFFFTKENIKYLLPENDANGKSNIAKLPIRVVSTDRLNTKTKDVIEYIKGDFRSFRISPKQVYDLGEIAKIDGITHQDMDMWLLLKLISWTAYCRRINVIISGIRESGKTSYFDALGQCTNQGYVVKQPRSVLGLSYGISENGYIVLDEISGLTAEQRRNIANFLFQVGERSQYFKTGKGNSAAHKLLATYDIPNLSCVILCNLIEDYTDTKTFFHYMFDNSQAINDRFFPLRLNGSDTPVSENQRRELNCYLNAKQFKDQDVILTGDIRNKYIGIVKSMEWYRVNWESLVDYDVVDDWIKDDNIKGRHYLSYREVCSGIYIYCKLVSTTDAKLKTLFDWYRELLLRWNFNYYDSLDKYRVSDDTGTVTQEVIG